MREVEALNFSWFLKLRWGAIAAELLVFFAGDRLMHVALPLAPMLLIVGVAVSTNVGGTLWARRRKSVPVSALAGLMVLDSLLLTAMLYFLGGDSNPFAVLYLVNIALAAVLLPPKWTWGITALSLICGGLLFLGRSLGPESSRAVSNDPLEWQLRELWLSFAVAAALLVYFIQRTVRMVRERERIAELARQSAERRGKLASLATLAAGAAHELATPLSTIAVAAKELERQLERGQSVSNAIGGGRGTESRGTVRTFCGGGAGGERAGWAGGTPPNQGGSGSLMQECHAHGSTARIQPGAQSRGPQRSAGVQGRFPDRPSTSTGWRNFADRDFRPGVGNVAGSARACWRAILHHQAARRGHGARPLSNPFIARAARGTARAGSAFPAWNGGDACAA